MNKRRKGFPSARRVKRGRQVVGQGKELTEKLGRNDLCPCGSGRRFQEVLPGYYFSHGNQAKAREDWYKSENTTNLLLFQFNDPTGPDGFIPVRNILDGMEFDSMVYLYTAWTELQLIFFFSILLHLIFSLFDLSLI